MYQNLQVQQTNRIKELESEVTQMRAAHTNAIQDLKSKFLAEKQTYQNESDSKINTMTKLASTVGDKPIDQLISGSYIACIPSCHHSPCLQ